MSHTAADSAMTERVIRAFRSDTHVRERLDDGGTLNIDRQLPYLIIYRRPPSRRDEGTDRLILGEASYLITGDWPAVSDTVHALATAATEELGSFLLIEVWSGDEGSRDFVVHGPDGPGAAVIDTLRRGLAALRAGGDATRVITRTSDERYPAELGPLMTARTCYQIGCLLVGLEVPPIFRDADTGAVYPVFLRRLRQLLSPVLRQAAYEFARIQTDTSFESYLALGPRRFGRAVADADRELAEIERSYSLLLLVSPLNSREAWSKFRSTGYREPPDFRYRLLPVDPDTLKRRLFGIDLEPVGDPAMAYLLHDKRTELDRQITLIGERGTPAFRYGSMRLYGEVDATLLDVALDILRTVPTDADDDARGERVSAVDFAAAARAELEHYRRTLPQLAADVQIRPDLTGLMVSRGDLLIGDTLSLRPARVQPLLHHEVGTHVLTYYNGMQQPLHQLATGLAGYDELQEGLAVLSEFLAGGLDAHRMCVLAGRVVAARSVEDGADFMETFGLLHDEHRFSAWAAFDIAERVHQSGGFTRDLIYLRGLIRLIEYLRAGGELEPLYIGKIAERHVEIIHDLRAREFLRPPVLLPRVLDVPGAEGRLDALRHGLTLTQMIG
jgi:uncharacterized protein (TIGR02421 family)